jgi:hypothetical protein
VSRHHPVCVIGRRNQTALTTGAELAAGGDTVLTGPLPGRAALYRVLAQIEALGLELLEVRRLPPV